MLDAVHLVERYAVPNTAAKDCSDVFSAYGAHAITRFRACEYAPMPDTINLQLLGLPTVFYFLLGCCSLENHKGQLSDPCSRLTNR